MKIDDLIYGFLYLKWMDLPWSRWIINWTKERCFPTQYGQHQVEWKLIYITYDYIR